MGKLILSIILVFTLCIVHAQTQPKKFGYAPVNGLEMYYEIPGTTHVTVMIQTEDLQRIINPFLANK